ncbi:hypothetical protein Sjap_023951 [Stephania japonica]|uniref:NB-ARC domain-containing protein n=1 Tax=Stephania japonica TaxID=461633 RepID=A0AAP0EL72_9MAGN
MLVGEARRKLGGKRFLLVLDNVWNEEVNKWEYLMKALISGAKGSKIIITTRTHQVASLVGTLPRYQLQPLSEYDAWSLFLQKAFQSPYRSKERRDLAMVGREIVRRSGGVPLAIEIIGSQLKSLGETLEALMVSYHSLPSHLKQCFSYCSVFRKGELIKKDTLVQLWMAEGFLTNYGNRVVEEDVGRQYADCLLRCCFFQAEESNRWGDDVVSFKMHDLVHDLAQSMVSPVDPTSALVDNIVRDDIIGNRRLQVAFTGEGASTATHVHGDLVNMIRGDRLRVLILRNCFYGIIIMRNVSPLIKLKRLRVLILERILVEELPNAIADLKQLRYLDLSGTKIKVLPRSFTALYNLQTLKLNSCSNLQIFPSDFTRKLINLRHLEIKSTSTPREITSLRFLQTLPQFTVSNENGGGISELKFLNLLRDDVGIKQAHHLANFTCYFRCSRPHTSPTKLTFQQ